MSGKIRPQKKLPDTTQNHRIQGFWHESGKFFLLKNAKTPSKTLCFGRAFLHGKNTQKNSCKMAIFCKKMPKTPSKTVCFGVAFLHGKKHPKTLAF